MAVFQLYTLEKSNRDYIEKAGKGKPKNKAGNKPEKKTLMEQSQIRGSY